MKKKFFKRSTAFVVASLMAVGVITVLPEKCLPQIGIVSAEETAANGVEVNDVNFPDEIFRQYVLENFDSDNDGFLSNEEISQIKAIDVYEKEIQSLKGIEYFTMLTYLDCYNNLLTSLDVSKNLQLTWLECRYNNISSIDLSNNASLTNLYCCGNGLNSLDLRNNIYLFDCSCSRNNIDYLDLSKNTNLKQISCGNNQLKSLDVSNNTALTSLMCAGNQLTSLDISNNTALELLDCNSNQLTSLDVSNNTALTRLNCDSNQLTSLDVSNNTALKWIDCDSNQLTSLDVSNNTALEWVNCHSNQLTSLGVTNNTALTSLLCYENQLTSLDVSNNTALEWLDCHSNQLTSLDVSNNTALTSFYYNNNSYNIGETCGAYELKNLPTSFDLTKVSNWQGATLKDDILTEIDGTGTITYDYDCGNNHTATFSLIYDYAEHSYDDGVVTTEPTEDTEGEKTYTCTNCGATKTEPIAKLENADGIEINSVNFPDEVFRQYVSDNFDKDNNGFLSNEEIGRVTLIELNDSGVQSLKGIEYFTALRKLYCMYNQLTLLDVSNNTELETLECDNNQLTLLDVSNNPKLTGLWCVDNHLTSLDVSNNITLSTLVCDNNQLASLDVSNNTMLTILGCGRTQLTSLDISNNTMLTNLGCNFNQLTSLDVSNNTALTYFECYSNQLTSLDVSKNTALSIFVCSHNQLTSLDVSNNTALTTFECNYNQINIGKISGAYDLKNLPADFDITKSSNWQGATLKDGMLTEIDGNGVITYDYDCGNNHTATFKLTYNYVESGNGGDEPTVPSQPTDPTNPSQPSNPQQPATNESETIISAKKGWGNVVKEINAANENSKINVDMGNTTTVPKNVMTAIKGKNIDMVLDMGDGITWTINGKDVTDPQSINFSVTKKKNSIPEDMISDSSNTVPLVLTHNGNFGCSAKLSIELGDNNNKKIANLYYYNTKTKELEFVDSSEIANGKANLVFTHASDWAIIISDTIGEYEDISSAAGVYKADDNSQAPLCIIVIIIAVAGFSSIIIIKRFAKNKH